MLTLEFSGPEIKKLLSYLKIVQNNMMTLLTGSKVSYRCPFSYLFMTCCSNYSCIHELKYFLDVLSKLGETEIENNGFGENYTKQTNIPDTYSKIK